MPKQLSVTGGSDIGRVRRRNEDAIALDAEAGVVVVADGMGGHPGGDVASRIAADTAAEVLVEAVRGRAPDRDFAAVMLGAAEEAVVTAHRRIRARGRERSELDGMGTTLTALAVDLSSRTWVIAHVGDSRAYRMRDEALEQLTRDDTWVQQQIDSGVLGPEAAKASPYAHLLTQCLGLEEPPRPQVASGECRAGDAFLLCTDGLVGMLDDETLTDLLRRHAGTNGTGDETVQALLAAANEAGGHDNVTAALVRLPDATT